MVGHELRIVSINLNKRLAGAHSQAAFLRWLMPLDATVVAVQEPTPPGTLLPEMLGAFRLIGGNADVALWAKAPVALPPEILGVPAIILDLGHLIICNVYLSGYASPRRVRQLGELRIALAGRAKPVVAVGDFNLAPLAMDGRHGDAASTWTTRRERTAFQHLTNELELVDLTSPFRLSEQHFTFERINSGKWTRFRCDLALAAASLNFTARYDHSVRNGSYAFTDHSACIVEGEIPVLPGPPATTLDVSDQTDRISVAPLVIRPENTAISRARPSKPARTLAESRLLVEWDVHSVLDYGCGRGADVGYFNDMGFAAVGYDPHPAFGFAAAPSDTFDLVLLLYVVNVLSSVGERIAVVRDAARFLKPGGKLLIVARSAGEIEREACANGWPPHSDGYLSNARRGMFQHGLTQSEIEALAKEAGLVSIGTGPLRLGVSTYAVSTLP